jgi:hypothetical protein
MDSNDLGTLGLIILTFALPLLAPLVDDLHQHRPGRRPVARRVPASRRTRSQGHPIGRIRRP